MNWNPYQYPSLSVWGLAFHCESCRTACLAVTIQMTTLCMTLFSRKGKRSLTKCKPNKSDENENGLANLLLDPSVKTQVGGRYNARLTWLHCWLSNQIKTTILYSHNGSFEDLLSFMIDSQLFQTQVSGSGKRNSIQLPIHVSLYPSFVISFSNWSRWRKRLPKLSAELNKIIFFCWQFVSGGVLQRIIFCLRLEKSSATHVICRAVCAIRRGKIIGWPYCHEIYSFKLDSGRLLIWWENYELSRFQHP